WLVATWLVWTTAEVPLLSRVVWTGGLAALVAARTRRKSPPDALYAAALGCAAVYIVLALGASTAARSQVRAELEARGLGPVERVMVGPAVANPFGGSVVAATPSEYRFGEWRWLATPRLVLEPDAVPKRAGDAAVIDAAAAMPPLQRFPVRWRFPYFQRP